MLMGQELGNLYKKSTPDFRDKNIKLGQSQFEKSIHIRGQKSLNSNKPIKFDQQRKTILKMGRVQEGR